MKFSEKRMQDILQEINNIRNVKWLFNILGNAAIILFVHSKYTISNMRNKYFELKSLFNNLHKKGVQINFMCYDTNEVLRYIV